jgi:hypothetical protein
MRFKFVVCKVLEREAYWCAAKSKNVVDVVLMAQGLHNEPDKLRQEVQKEIDRIEDVQGKVYDAVLLGYALCSNGIDRLTPKIPLVVPRGHDCMTLLLGSAKKYQDYFDSHRGIYWYSPGWIEQSLQPGKERYEMVYKQYVEQYGEENAAYLMDMEQGWMKEYGFATYVDWGLANSEHYKEYTRQCAEYLGWQYDELPGDASMMEAMVEGNWDAGRFLVVEPGKRIVADLTDPGLIRAE